MKILFVAPYVPNLIRVRPYNLIRALAARGNQVTVLVVTTSEREYLDVERLRAMCARVEIVRVPAWRSLLNCVAALPSGAPLQSVYSWDRGLLDQALALIGQNGGKPLFDAVHVEHLRGARYAEEIIAWAEEKRVHLPVVWDSVDAISLLFRQAMVKGKSPVSRAITRFELGRTEKYEARLLSRFEDVLVTSEMDRQALLSLPGLSGRVADVQVLPNGVDLVYFQPPNAGRRDPETLVISGKMSYHANVAMVLNFVREIMPGVWAQRPGVKVKVVGKDPPSQVQSLASDPRIEVTGTVPDVRPYLQGATLAVAPVAYGVGIQNKVLEAMACATPVVASRQAVSAISAAPGSDLVIAEGAQEFAGALLDLLGDADRRAKIGLAGRRYVERCHDWSDIAARLESIYVQARGRAARPNSPTLPPTA